MGINVEVILTNLLIPHAAPSSRALFDLLDASDRAQHCKVRVFRRMGRVPTVTSFHLNPRTGEVLPASLGQGLLRPTPTATTSSRQDIQSKGGYGTERARPPLPSS